jgi:hypothetical protein
MLAINRFPGGLPLKSIPFALAGLVLGVAFSGCSGSTSTTPASAPAAIPTSYPITGVMAIPGVTGRLSADISWVDRPTGVYLMADRSTNGVDVFSLASLSYTRTAGQGAFTGSAASPFGGPNGVMSVGNFIAFAGDGNSTTKVVNYQTGALLATITNVNPVKTSQPQLAGTQCAATVGVPTVGAANARADELDYDPVDSEVLIINDASCPAFGTFISTVAPYNVLGTVAFTTATNGAEQPRWDPTQGKFLMALPATIANPNGEVDIIDPKTFAINKVLPEPFACNGNGLALGQNETLFVGCSNALNGLLFMNAATGATIATVPNTGGADEVWYNPTVNRFYCACSSFNPASLFVTDASGNLLTSISTAKVGGSHSIAVDPGNDTIFAPQPSPPGVAFFTH